MGKFTKGMKRPPGAGRRPGSRNKFTRSVKEAFEAAFKELQRDPKTELAAWARKSKANLREFYKLSARFINPAMIEVDARSVTVEVIDPAEREATLLETARGIAYVLGTAERIEAEKRLLLPASIQQPDELREAALVGGEQPGSDDAAGDAQTEGEREAAAARAWAQGDRLAEAEIARELRRRELPERARSNPRWRR